MRGSGGVSHVAQLSDGRLPGADPEQDLRLHQRLRPGPRPGRLPDAARLRPLRDRLRPMAAGRAIVSIRSSRSARRDDNPGGSPGRARTESSPRASPTISRRSRTSSASRATSRIILRNGRPEFDRQVAQADPNFFRRSSIAFVRGDAAAALRRPDSMVLSRSEAMNLFGSLDIVGRTLTCSAAASSRISRSPGVFEDIPRNSHMNFRAVGRHRRRSSKEPNAVGDASTAGSI